MFFWAVSLDQTFALLGRWRTVVITYLTAAKTPDESHTRKGGFTLSQVPGQSPLWHEVAGHIAAPGRGRGMLMLSSSLVSLVLRTVSLPELANLQTPSQTCSETHLQGDPPSCQTDSQYKPCNLCSSSQEGARAYTVGCR